MLWFLLFILGILICKAAISLYAAHGGMMYLLFACIGLYCLFKGLVRSMLLLRRPSRQ